MSEAALPDRLDLRVNEEISIALPGVGVSGYVWRLQKAGTFSVAETAVQRANATSGGSVGRAAPEMLVIRAAAPGNLTLHLSLQRPWERDVTPLQRHTVEVTVT